MTTDVPTSEQKPSRWFALAAFLSGMCLSAAVALIVMMTLGVATATTPTIFAVAVMGAGSLVALVAVFHHGSPTLATASAVLGALAPFTAALLLS